MKPVVKIQPFNENAVKPVYSTAGAAGADLASVIDTVIPAGKRQLVPTGWNMELPPGYEAQVRPRSGLALKHGITVMNSPGTVDEDYRGPVGVILFNSSDVDFEIKVGDRIGQLVIKPVVQAEFEVVIELSDSARGGGGFGSTGLSSKVA